MFDVAGRDVIVRTIEDMVELRRCEAIQRVVWGMADLEIVSGALIRAAVHGGGLAAGAFIEGEMAGFVFGFVVLDRGVPGLHSHMLAVLPAHRGLGLGRALKWFQRDWCLSSGLSSVSWTFDPLQSRNARLNLEHLGAVGVEYLPDFYGQLGGSLNTGLPTDRMMVCWDLTSAPVEDLARGLPRPGESEPETASALEPLGVGRGFEARLDLDADRVMVAIPDDINRLKVEDETLARRWQEQVRSAMQSYMGRGYRPTRFLRGGYYLKRASKIL